MEEEKNENTEHQDESGEEIEDEYGAWDSVTDVLTNKNFMSMIERITDKIVGAINEHKKADNDRLKIEGEKYLQFENNRRLYLWQRFFLSALVISLLGLTAAYKWLPTDSIIPLLVGVIASLFVVPKKE